MFKNIASAITGILLLAADQAAKFFVTHSLRPGEGMPVIEGVFHITLVLNTGCAFGLFKDKSTIFFLAIAFAAVLFLAFFFLRAGRGGAFSRLAAALVISGSASNLLDRLRFGYVIDFLDFRIWPVFNFGDSAITIGVAIFILKLFMKSPKSESPSPPLSRGQALPSPQRGEGIG